MTKKERIKKQIYKNRDLALTDVADCARSVPPLTECVATLLADGLRSGAG